MIDLEILDVTTTGTLACPGYKIAYVLGVHFKVDEWGSRRCGSVVTTIHEGRSRYCIVNDFIRVANKDFACVTWLSKPHYPYAPIPLVVRVHLHAEIQNTMPSLLPLNTIDPTPVLVEPDNDDVHYYMMRVQGFDRVRFV